MPSLVVKLQPFGTERVKVIPDMTVDGKPLQKGSGLLFIRCVTVNISKPF